MSCKFVWDNERITHLAPNWWKIMGVICIYHQYSPKYTPFLSQLRLTLSLFSSFIFSLCQVSSFIFMLYHLRHPFCRCAIRPTPSILHCPSVTPSLQPPAPSVLSPCHPQAASSLFPSEAQLNEIWLEVSCISLISAIYKKYQQQNLCNLLGMSHVYFTGKRTISMLNPFMLFWVFRGGLRSNYQNHRPSILQGFVWSCLYSLCLSDAIW